MIKRNKIADDELDDMEIVSSEDDSFFSEDIQESSNVRIHIIYFYFTNALTNPFVVFKFCLG